MPDQAPGIGLEETSGNHVGGVVLSAVFEDLGPPSNRTEWQELDVARPFIERRRSVGSDNSTGNRD